MIRRISQRLRWFEHVQRRKSKHVGQRTLRMENDLRLNMWTWLWERPGEWFTVVTPKGNSQRKKHKYLSLIHIPQEWRTVFSLPGSSHTSVSTHHFFPSFYFADDHVSSERMWYELKYLLRGISLWWRISAYMTAFNSNAKLNTAANERLSYILQAASSTLSKE